MNVKAVVENFFEQYPKHEFDKGHILIHPGDAVNEVYYLIDGSVLQYDISSVGNEVVVNAFKPLAFFPMSYAINHNQNFYFFEAASPVVVRTAPAADVVEFLHREPDVAFDLLSRVYRGADGLLRRTAHLMGGNARSRLIFELLNAAHRFGKKSPGEIHIPMSEGDLAKRSGLSRETVSRAIKELKADRIVGVEQRGVVIFDVRRLEAAIGDTL
jgi:CRP-like cAMP-binding protein